MIRRKLLILPIAIASFATRTLISDAAVVCSTKLLSARTASDQALPLAHAGASVRSFKQAEFTSMFVSSAQHAALVWQG